MTDLTPIITTFTLVVGLFKTAVTMGGFGALGAAIVNGLKTLGWVKDGQAPSVLVIVNGIALAAVLLTVAASGISLDQFNVVAGLAAVAITALVTFVTAVVSLFGGSRFAHFILRGLPVIGKSYGLENEEEVEQVQPP
jgi:hypothetical protein